MSFNFPRGIALTPSTIPVRDFLPSPASIDEPKWIEKYGIAGRIWEASHVLGIYLQPPDDLTVLFDPPCPLKGGEGAANNVILELGAGTGVVGLQIARLLPHTATIFLTDLPEVLPLLEQNAARVRAWANAAQIDVLPLEWGKKSDAASAANRVMELPPCAGSNGEMIKRRLTHIVCSDLVYFPHLLSPLLSTLLHLTSPDFMGTNAQPPQILIAYQIRNLTNETPFWAAFGYWFHFTPVVLQPKSVDIEAVLKNFKLFGPIIPRTLSEQFRILPDCKPLHGTYIFLCRRRSERMRERIPATEDLLDYGQDSFFETMLLMNTSSIL
ncbi:hypothetical protein DACRYDRAFT_104992 [Dacryopinax primogenitus]|uniref:S-adenosyl-L-methionine-dependent methyltransferase n=1 Tax=Dacryopinax primogenitus (strain DJM 731) TaxID=1858805 RepID=M5GG97_DACPD|nr:uncharacterized protein DACRYDRAFT_104992 [Dacryopinax primogenitus]EJU05108.1 hypothetical protein DACRYDRAFT_104992 [Dacryopinax primogenitus]